MDQKEQKKLKRSKVTYKVGFVLLSLAFLFLVNFLGVRYYLAVQKNGTAAVNVSDRNLALMHKTAYLAERVAKGRPVQQALKNRAAYLEASLSALKNGGVAPGFSEYDLAPLPRKLKPSMYKAEKLWEEIKANLEVVSTQPLEKDTTVRIDYNTLEIEDSSLLTLVRADSAATFSFPKFYETAGLSKKLLLSPHLTRMLLASKDSVTLSPRQLRSRISRYVLEANTRDSDSNPATYVRADSTTMTSLADLLEQHVWMKKKVANQEVIQALASIEEKTPLLIEHFQDMTTHYAVAVEQKQDNLKVFLFAILALSIGLVILGFYLLNRYINKPIEQLRKSTEKLAEGELDFNTTYDSNDDIGQSLNQLKQINENLAKAADFAEKIGAGNFETEYQPAGEKDKLGQSLVQMNEKLQDVNEEDRKRNWVNDGLSEFTDILRNNQDDLKALSTTLLTKLIRHIEANQGAVYIVNEQDEKEPFLQLTALYAWDRVKYRQKSLQAGEGLAGQVWLEKKSVYLKEIPQDYVEIASGLGHANPNFVMIIPIMHYDEVQGIMEIASFREYEAFELDFINRLADNFGATVASVKTNEHTRQLLEESQQAAQELKAQEEEMRQNMEEMSATQEEIARKEKEYLARIAELEAELNKVKEGKTDQA